MPQPAHSGRKASGRRIKISDADMKKAEKDHKAYVNRRANADKKN